MSRRPLTSLLALGCLSVPLARAQGSQAAAVVFENVRIFDGTSDRLSPASNILVVGNTIRSISTAPIVPPADAQVTVIAGGGRVLMPGLIDAHWHALMSANTLADLTSADIGYVHVCAGRGATQTLMRGFTTIRDVGGPVFGLKQAIDRGVIAGPRIYPSGATISQTSGHGDFRSRVEPSRRFSGLQTYLERIGVSVVADGVDEVLAATRENLRLGASQIKLMASGGVASVYDPLDTRQYLPEELEAAVRAAADWGTYVTVHAYTPASVRRAVEAGVKCIEHGHLLDEDTMQYIAEHDVWLSMQPFEFTDNTFPTEEQQAKNRQVCDGTANVYIWARKHKVKLAWGTDLVFNPAATHKQNEGIRKLGQWFSPFEVLRMITHDNAQLLALSGPRNPYPGRLGVIEEGALADILLVDGNPLEDLSILVDYEKNFKVVMKDGIVFKNALP
ncbi:MAG: amidohydrolase family protein [Planctomycetota bacterium]|nr:MAG: amidohydrolase family protein [Planctomycetota bacterium]